MMKCSRGNLPGASVAAQIVIASRRSPTSRRTGCLANAPFDAKSDRIAEPFNRAYITNGHAPRDGRALKPKRRGCCGNLNGTLGETEVVHARRVRNKSAR